MWMADNSSSNWSLGERSCDDDDVSDRLCFDMDSLWDMVEAAPDSPKNTSVDLPVNFLPQGFAEFEGSSPLGVDVLPGFDTRSYSYHSEVLDSRSGSSEGSFDSVAKSVILDVAKQDSFAQNVTPSGSLAEWIYQKASYFSQDTTLKAPGCSNIYGFPAGDPDHVSDIGGALDGPEFRFRCSEVNYGSKGLPDNELREISDITRRTYGGLAENNSHSPEAPHMEESCTVNSGLSSHSASHIQPINCELSDIDFPYIKSTGIVESYDQYSLSSDNIAYLDPSKECVDKYFGNQSMANNVEGIIKVEDVSGTHPTQSTCLNGQMKFDVQVERYGVSAALRMENSDAGRMNDNYKSAEYTSQSCEMPFANVDFELSVGKTLSTQILPQITSNTSGKKQAIQMTEENNYELSAPQGATCQPHRATKMKSSGVPDRSSSKKQAFHMKDKGNNRLLECRRARDSFETVETRPCPDPVGDSYCLDIQDSKQPCTQRSESIRTQLVPITKERESRLAEFNGTDSHFSKVSHEAVLNYACVDGSQVDDDDDSDMVILEHLSGPVSRNRSPVVVKSDITSRSSSVVDSHNHLDIGGLKLKTKDERSIFRAALQDLSQPKSEATPPDGLLAVPLLKHQRIALSWMVQKETSSLNCSGGILADDQGLGKTISTIALILKERSPSSKACSTNNKQMETLNLDDEDGVTELNRTIQGADSYQVIANRSLTLDRNPSVQSKGRTAAGTLIVCPTSVLRQWSEELHNKVTSAANLSVLTYHGGNRTKDPLELAKYDVVLTTYAIVSMEVPKQPLDEDDDEMGRESHISPMGHPLTKKRRYPPSSEKRCSKSKKGDGELIEPVSRPLAQVRWFRVVLDEAQSIKNHRTQVARACWGLRAKRRWCLSGTPIQNAIDDLYSYFRFLKYDPYAAYKSFCSTIKVPIQKHPAKGFKKLQAILKTVMLRRTKGTILDGQPIINLPPKTIELKKVDFTMEERDFYCRLEANSRAQFAEYAAAGTVKQNYVNILLMLLRLRQACDHPLLVSGCGSSSVWTSSIEMAKKLPPEKQVSLLNCLEASLAICSICNDPPEDAVVTSCGHVFCNQCICEHLTGDDNQCPTTSCKVRLSISSVFSRETLRNSLSESQDLADCSGIAPADTLQPCSSGSFDSSKIKAAIEVLQSLSRPHNFSQRTSSVIDIDQGANDTENLSDPLVHGLQIYIHNDPTLHLDSDSNTSIPAVREKAIVFSQWTRMLDLLEACLKDSSINYRRLDGTMSVIARDKAVKDFNTQPEVSVIIMSLKAASLGLNMVAACHVLLLDLWWNPTTEDQAIDRAHRIGQTRPVSVLRLTVKDTVEDRILALQEKKRKMVASAFGEDETGSRQTRLTVEDLEYLFMYN